LPDGTYTLTATATDAVGNASGASTAFTLTIDTAAPALPTVAASNGSTLTGTAEAGSLVRIDLNGDGTADVTVTADGGGQRGFPPRPRVAQRPWGRVPGAGRGGKCRRRAHPPHHAPPAAGTGHYRRHRQCHAGHGHDRRRRRDQRHHAHADRYRRSQQY